MEFEITKELLEWAAKPLFNVRRSLFWRVRQRIRQGLATCFAPLAKLLG